MTANGEDKKEAVYDFMSWWNSEENQAEWVTRTGFAPTRTDMLDNPTIANNHFISAFASVSDVARCYLPKLTNFGEVEDDILTPLYESILLKQATIEEAFEIADTRLTELLNDQ